MKKYLIIILIMVIALNICSCITIPHNIEATDTETSFQSDHETIASIPNYSEQFLNKIYEVSSSSATDIFNHKNVISSKPFESIDKEALTNIKININKVEEDLYYHCTLFYPIGEKKVHMYYVNGNENKKVLISQDGFINSILYEFATLNIENTAKPENILPLLNDKLSPIIDVSYYSKVQISGGDKESTNGFGIYSFLYYNEIGGYLTDYTKVSVSDNGSVFGFSINNMKKSDIEIKISTESEEKLLNLKLDDIYTTTKTEYLSYNTSFPPQAVIYKDEFYISYSVSANYMNNQSSNTTSFINRILIPIDLLTNN